MKNTNAFFHSDNSWLPSSDSIPQNDVDLSWLPNYDNKSFTTDSDESSYQHAQSDSDDSWLPTNNKRKSPTPTPTPAPASKSNNSSRQRRTEKDPSDDSWLPSIPIIRNKSKNNLTLTHESRIPNCKKNNTPSCKSNTNSYLSNRFRKTDTSPDRSWLPNTNNADKKKETLSTTPTTTTTSTTTNHLKKSGNNNNHWERAREAVTVSSSQQSQNTKVSSKKPESSRLQGHVSPSLSESSVETDSLGGVSTLLRRWKDAETKNSNRKLKASASKSLDGGKCGSVECFVDSECGKSGGSMPVSCVVSSRGTNINDAEKEKLTAGNKNETVVGNRSFTSVIGRPRLIRGRQAFLDFLNMVERDKRRELESLAQKKPVSKFPNRGRIQAMLRVRLIKIGAENQKESKSHKHSVSKTMKSIWDKISTGVKQDTSASRKVNNNAEGVKKIITSPERPVDCSLVRELTITTTATNSQEPGPATTSHQSPQEAKEETNTEMLVTNTSDCQDKIGNLSTDRYSSGMDEKAIVVYNPGLANCHNWINEYSQTQSEWDDDEDDDDEYYNYSYNWISEIARPRSDWECMRQKRYQEMLHLQSCNQEIQQLLERKSVSGFLSSDQRNLLDQLMMSRAQGDSRTELRKEEDKYGEDEFTDHTAYSSPPTQSPAPEQSWNHHHHLHHPNPYLQNNNINNNRQSSFINHPSIEMGLIYDLRVYVEQIHQEVMELRKAVNSCINMQVQNQQQSIQKKRGDQVSTTRNCCVCYAMKADSFLYRCGHMCTCYDCGLELQCTSGKCPICEDAISDVVRAYVYGD